MGAPMDVRKMGNRNVLGKNRDREVWRTQDGEKAGPGSPGAREPKMSRDEGLGPGAGEGRGNQGIWRKRGGTCSKKPGLRLRILLQPVGPVIGLGLKGRSLH